MAGARRRWTRALPAAALATLAAPAAAGQCGDGHIEIAYAGVYPPVGQHALDASDPLFQRPRICSSLSLIATAVAYDTFTITNHTANNVQFRVRSALPGGGACPAEQADTFFVLYDEQFDPADARLRCLAVHDDIDGGNNRCSRLDFSIPAGGRRIVVVTAFNNATATPNPGLFPYQLDFAGTAGEPGTPVLAAAQASVDFGRQLVGTSTLRLQTLQSTGNWPVCVRQLSTPAAPFTAAAGGNCGMPPFELAVGGSCTLALAFQPDAAGLYSQSASAAHDHGLAAWTVHGQSLPSTQIPAADTSSRSLLAALLALIGCAGLLRRSR